MGFSGKKYFQRIFAQRVTYLNRDVKIIEDTSLLPCKILKSKLFPNVSVFESDFTEFRHEIEVIQIFNKFFFQKSWKIMKKGMTKSDRTSGAECYRSWFGSCSPISPYTLVRTCKHSKRKIKAEIEIIYVWFRSVWLCRRIVIKRSEQK